MSDLILRHEIVEDVFGRHDLGEWTALLRGHAYRSLNYCMHLAPSEVDRYAVAVALHDIPAVRDNDLRYFEPAKVLVEEYLKQIDRPEWLDAIGAMIDNHHKVRPYTGPWREEVEAVRRADWVDVTMNVATMGVDRSLVRAINKHFPVRPIVLPALRTICGYAIRHPRAPLPMMRW